MNAEQPIIACSDASAPRERGWHSQIADDKAMLRAARDLTKDIAEARAAIYWPDMLGSALVGYVTLAAAILI
ncbi:MAG: fatty acid desaturase, partial [Erythrobacter sp.]|nr:fatty acid desaturase [Erythrobacter sp.]